MLKTVFFFKTILSFPTIASSKKEKEIWKTSEIKKKNNPLFCIEESAKVFSDTSNSSCHKVAASHQLTISQCQDVRELMDNQ